MPTLVFERKCQSFEKSWTKFWDEFSIFWVNLRWRIHFALIIILIFILKYLAFYEISIHFTRLNCHLMKSAFVPVFLLILRHWIRVIVKISLQKALNCYLTYAKCTNTFKRKIFVCRILYWTSIIFSLIPEN